MRSPHDDLDPIDLTAALVAIDSVNPDLVPGAQGEAEIAAFCESWLRRHAVEVHRLEERPGRPSIVGIVRGTGGGQSLMLNGHIDTVALEGYNGNPLEPRREAGRLHGRGAFDMKGGLAAAMTAVAMARSLPLRGDVLVACVADEEHSSRGTAEVLRHFTADAGIVTEPSHLELTVAHKGFAWFEVVVEGRAAHGSRPELGVDAIAKAGHVLVALEAWGERLRSRPGHSLLGHGSVHASIIRGGLEASSYPATCHVTIERRTLPGEDAEAVERELRDILDHLAASVPDFRARIEPGLVRHPFEADAESRIAQLVRRHAEAVLGRPPAIRGEPFWTDCALLQGAGIPCVLIGPDGAGAHAASEWVDESSIQALSRILVSTIADFCA